MKIITVSDYNAMAVESAKIIAAYIKNNPGKLMCFAAGDTPLGTFAELIKMQDRGEVDLSSVYYAQLDEWVGLGPNDKGSCLQVMNEAFFGPANISKDKINIFDGLAEDQEAQCRKAEDWIKKQGGIGFALLGVGMNGHIGFNEPGAPDTEGCFIVELDDTTKKVSAKYFGKSLPVQTGITIGRKTLLDSGEILLQISGKSKAPAAEKTLKGEIGADFPASFIRNHKNAIIMLDEDAAGLI